MAGSENTELDSQQCFEARLVYWIAAAGSAAIQLQCLAYFSGYLVGLFEAVASEKPLYTAGLRRSSLDPYVQSAFVEMQAPQVVQKALERAFSGGWTL